MTLTQFNETDRSARSSSLDISDEEMRDLSAQFVTLARNYFAGVSQMPVFTKKTGGGIKSRVEAVPPLQGETLRQLLTERPEESERRRPKVQPPVFCYVDSS